MEEENKVKENITEEINIEGSKRTLFLMERKDEK